MGIQFSVLSTLPLQSFLVVMKEMSSGLLVGVSSMSSRAMLAFVTRSFSVRSVGCALGRVLSVKIRSFLSALRPLAMMSECSEFVAACATAV